MHRVRRSPDYFPSGTSISPVQMGAPYSAYRVVCGTHLMKNIAYAPQVLILSFANGHV